MIMRLKRASQVLSEGLCVAGAVATMLMVLFVSYSSISRYVFGRAVNYMEEVVGLLLMLVCFSAYPYVFLRGNHIRVELILTKLSRRTKGCVELITRVILLFYLIIFAKISYDFVALSYRVDARSVDANLYEVPWMAVMPISAIVFAAVVGISCVEAIWDMYTGRKKQIEFEEVEAREEAAKTF